MSADTASDSPKLLIDAAFTAADWHRFFEQVVSSDECDRGKPGPIAELSMRLMPGSDRCTRCRASWRSYRCGLLATVECGRGKR